MLHVKGLCEKRLVDLGCDVTFVGNTVGEAEDAEDAGDDRKEEDISLRKQLSFRAVMNSTFARK